MTRSELITRKIQSLESMANDPDNEASLIYLRHAADLRVLRDAMTEYEAMKEVWPE